MKLRALLSALLLLWTCAAASQGTMADGPCRMDGADCSSGGTTLPAAGNGVLYNDGGDNLSWLTGPWITLTGIDGGSLVIATDDDELGELEPGDEGDVLTIVAGVPAWAPPAGGSTPTVVNLDGACSTPCADSAGEGGTTMGAGDFVQIPASLVGTVRRYYAPNAGQPLTVIPAAVGQSITIGDAVADQGDGECFVSGSEGAALVLQNVATGQFAAVGVVGTWTVTTTCTGGGGG